MQARARGCAVGVVLVLWACTEAPPAPPRQATAWRAATESQALRIGGLGTDCAQGGDGACETGICVHARPEHDQGYFCGAACQADENCPVDWRCRELLPGRPDLSVCIPPPGWRAREVAAVRPWVRPARTQQFVEDRGVESHSDAGGLYRQDPAQDGGTP